MKALRACVLAAACLVTSAAQSQAMFQVFFDHANPKQPTPTTCTQEVGKLQELLAKYPHPDNWRYIVVCDDKSWLYVMSKVGEGADYTYVYGDTNRTQKLTFFRGQTLLGNTEISADETVAHELAHIFLKTGDERKVRLLVQEWMAKYGLSPLAPLQ